MLALGVMVFFAVTTAVVALLLFPEAREAVALAFGRGFSRLGSVFGRWRGRAVDRVGDSGDALRASSRRTARLVSRNRYVLGGALLLLCLPPLLILALRQRPTLESYTTTELEISNPQILELLRGERLAPPPELPPDVFIAAEAEVAAASPSLSASIELPVRLSSADRRWARIDPDFQQRVLAVFQLMREQGYEMVLVEGYRSPERQNQLSARGGVTNARGGQSCHQYGVAADAALFRNGKLQWDMSDPWTREGYHRYGELAQQAGLEWGGAWKKLKDYVHVELKDSCRRQRRNAGFG